MDAARWADVRQDDVIHYPVIIDFHAHRVPSLLAILHGNMVNINHKQLRRDHSILGSASDATTYEVDRGEGCLQLLVLATTSAIVVYALIPIFVLEDILHNIAPFHRLGGRTRL